jgi:H+/Cl- antiporter ClcA
LPSNGEQSTQTDGALRRSAAGVQYLARWLLLTTPVALATGSAVALFLWSLNWATDTRLTHPSLLWWLPVAGAVVGLLYARIGVTVERGTNLIVDEIHEPGGGVPALMAPLILASTIVTHLFGGSAGREGTAVQMGGSIASTVDRAVFARVRGWFGLSTSDRAVLLQVGIAAGFGAVFGTPLAGAVFALEVLTRGRLAYSALLPCLMAALLGDWTTRAWHIQHTAFPTIALATLNGAHLSLVLLAKVSVAAVLFGLVGRLFAESMHRLGWSFKRLIPQPWLRPAIGGVAVIGLTLLIGSRDYLGLGVASADPATVTIVSAFHDGGALPWSWLLKFVFTAITLASGFKGGEVTPLFFIGATLGNALAVLLHAPVELFAALGFVAVFAGATNTPLACTLMGLELFGVHAAIYIAAACGIAYLCSGHASIYTAQRIPPATPALDVNGLSADAKVVGRERLER